MEGYKYEYGEKGRMEGLLQRFGREGVKRVLEAAQWKEGRNMWTLKRNLRETNKGVFIRHSMMFHI